jgi:hypothetical protein
MVSIGMNFAAEPCELPANIEDTLVGASVAGMEGGDLRTLAVLVTWLEQHLRYVNVDRLTRLVIVQPAARVRTFWAAIASWGQGDRRVRRLSSLAPTGRLDLLPSGTAFQVSRKGEDPRFAGGPLRVPAEVLRDRPADVLTPAELVKKHPTYRMRILLGPTYRADMWAVLDHNPRLRPAELARMTYGSFATAHTVTREHKLLVQAGVHIRLTPRPA